VTAIDLAQIHESVGKQSGDTPGHPKSNQLYDNEVEELDCERARLGNDTLRANNEKIRAENTLRKNYARYIYWFVVAWVASIIGIVICHGFKLGGFQLSDTTLIAVISGNTLTIVGMLVTIVKYLFPERG
jgi:hypothetical protein